MLSSTIEIISHSADETIQIGRDLAGHLTEPVIVLLSGDLGSGKTTLTKGIISGLGLASEEDVTSPTFTLVHVFRKQRDAGSVRPGILNVYHVDLYRVESFHGFETLALEDAFAQPAVIIIEWAERFCLRNDWPQVSVVLKHLGDDTRRITIAGTGSRAELVDHARPARPR